VLTPDERARRMQGILRDRAARRRLADNLVPGLPVDGDPPELRRSAEKMGDSLPGVLEALVSVSSSFFDRVSAEWEELFPGTPARPVRFEESEREFKLVLSVPSAGAAFALRAQMSRMRRALKGLEGAPKKKLSLILRIG